MIHTTCHVARQSLPLIIVHGGAGSYLKTTTAAQRQVRGARMLEIAQLAMRVLEREGGRAATLAAIAEMERDPSFNIAAFSFSIPDGSGNAQGMPFPNSTAIFLNVSGTKSLS